MTKPSPEEIERFLKVILDVETKGGSTGYKNNPNLFQEFAVEVSKSKTEEDLVIDSLEEIKTSKDTNDSIKKLEVLEARAKSHKDERFRALLPKFQFLKSNVRDLNAYGSLIKDLRILSELQRDISKGVNQRVLQDIEGMEALGGSEGFKKHISEMQPTDTTYVTATTDACGDWSHECFGRFCLIFGFFVGYTTASCIHVEGSGWVWGLGASAITVWGNLIHKPPNDMNGIETTMSCYGVGGSGAMAWYWNKLTDGLMARFYGFGVGAGSAGVIKAGVGWNKN